MQRLHVHSFGSIHYDQVYVRAYPDGPWRPFRSSTSVPSAIRCLHNDGRRPDKPAGFYSSSGSHGCSYLFQSPNSPVWYLPEAKVATHPLSSFSALFLRWVILASLAGGNTCGEVWPNKLWLLLMDVIAFVGPLSIMIFFYGLLAHHIRTTDQGKYC